MSTPVTNSSIDTNTRPASPLVYPLDDFYAQAEMPLPPIDLIPGPEVPEPYQSLLVHTRDMTPTLAAFHQSAILLRVLRCEQQGDIYFREVVLITESEEKPVEFGAIKIYLNLFPAQARQHILEARLPLGQILHTCTIAHGSRPKAFLRIQSDAFINRALQLQGAHTLYGRRNTLVDPAQRPLAEIVEILPPANHR